VDDRAVARLGLAIAFSAGFLCLRRLYPECESVVDGMLTAENSSRNNKVSNFQPFQAKHFSANGRNRLKGLKSKGVARAGIPGVRGQPY